MIVVTTVPITVKITATALTTTHLVTEAAIFTVNVMCQNTIVELETMTKHLWNACIAVAMICETNFFSFISCNIKVTVGLFVFTNLALTAIDEIDSFLFTNNAEKHQIQFKISGILREINF